MNPLIWLRWTARDVCSRSTAYRCTNCCPCSDFEETLWAQFWDGELSVWMSNLVSFGIPWGNFIATVGPTNFLQRRQLLLQVGV